MLIQFSVHCDAPSILPEVDPEEDCPSWDLTSCLLPCLLMIWFVNVRQQAMHILVSLHHFRSGPLALQVCAAVCVCACGRFSVLACRRALNLWFHPSRTPARALGPWRSSCQATGRKSGKRLTMRSKRGKVGSLSYPRTKYMEDGLIQDYIYLFYLLKWS